LIFDFERRFRLKKKEEQSPRYLSCQCIRGIIGKTYGCMIHMNLAGRMIQLISQCFEINQKAVTETIANYYIKKEKKISADDFNGLIKALYNIKHPQVVLLGEMGELAESLITIFKKAGWGPNQFTAMYEYGIPHVERIIKKKGGIW